MSESDTMFNERDRRCATLQLMLSTDPNYDNRTIASTLKMQIRTVQRLRTQLNASDDPGGGGAERHCQEDLDQAITDETPQWPIRQIARYLGVSHTTVNTCVKEGLKCRSYRRQTSQILTEKTKNLRLIKSVRPSWPEPLDYFVWSYVENITNMTSHNTKASLICRVFAGACGKDMLPVPDPYRGGDWGYIE